MKLFSLYTNNGIHEKSMSFPYRRYKLIKSNNSINKSFLSEIIESNGNVVYLINTYINTYINL